MGASVGLFTSDSLMFMSFSDTRLQVFLIDEKMPALRAAKYAIIIKWMSMVLDALAKAHGVER